MKTLIIDAQIWQTNAWYRGMGGYTRSLLSAFLRQHDNAVRLVLILNKNMTVEGRLEAISAEYPSAEIHQLDLPVDPPPSEEPTAKAVLQQFITDQFTAEDDLYYFIPALFLFSYAAVFPDTVKKVLLFYDMTPLIYWEHFAKYFPPHLYFDRFKVLFEADILFSISETTANDLSKYLGLPPENIVNLDGSINEVKGDGSANAETSDIIKQLGLTDKKFFLLPTGGLPHKNNVRAAEAFRMLREQLSDNSLRLVATSFFDDIDKEELRLLVGDDIIFTGNVTDQEIETLYATCNVVLFPPLYEGLGMPVLEGVANLRPVACSDIAVFREIPNFRQALYVFDPYDVASIAEAMFAAIAQADFAAKQTHYAAITDKYNWERSARLFAEALADDRFFTRKPTERVKIAVTCPDPRKDSGAAVFAQRLYGYGLTAGIEFVYFIDSGDEDSVGLQPAPDYIRYMTTCYDIGDFYREYETGAFTDVVHFLSDDPQFYKQLRAALATPGVLYLAHASYREVVLRAAEAGLVSESQLLAETQLADRAVRHHMFDGVTLLAKATAVIAEQPVAAAVRKTIKHFGITAPVLDVKPCTVVNDVSSAQELTAQAAAYATIIDFLREKRR